jgi:hypothetical protein
MGSLVLWYRGSPYFGGGVSWVPPAILSGFRWGVNPLNKIYLKQKRGRILKKYFWEFFRKSGNPHYGNIIGFLFYVKKLFNIKRGQNVKINFSENQSIYY